MAGFTEIFAGLGSLLGFLFSLGFSIEGTKAADFISNYGLITSNPQLYAKGLIILLVIVVICGGVGTVLGAILDSFNKKRLI